MPFYIRLSSLITPVHCITQTEEPNSQIGIDKNIECLADKGDQGIQKLHKNSRIPNKKKKNQELSLEEKKFNRQLSRERIVIEPIHRSLKRFKIL